MSNLSAFLSQNAVKAENVKKVISDRFIGESGKPEEWEFTAVSAETDAHIRKSCMVRVPVPGKKNMYQQEIDREKYTGQIAAQTVVYPNLNDAALQDSYGVKDAASLLKKMLISGEYTTLMQVVNEVNGYDVTMADKVDEAKNS